MIAAAALQEQAERLVARAERIAMANDGWQKVFEYPVGVARCRGFGGAHEPHFQYRVWAGPLVNREQAVWFTHDAIEAEVGGER